MFLGHFAAGFAAKKLAPKESLGVLFAAAVWLDILWPFLVLAGWESFRIVPGSTVMSPFEFVDYPLSHSLAMTLAWAVGAGLLALALGKGERVALVIAGLVASHWLLDLIVHKPDLPLLPVGGALTGMGLSRKVGFGLWNSAWGTYLVELSLFAAGFWVYFTSTKPLNKWGTLGLFGLGIFLLVGFLSASNSVPPDNPSLVVALGSAMMLIVLGAAFWLDDQRKSV